MTLKTVLDSLDGVDDAFKPLYRENDKKFVLDIDGVDDHPTVRNLKSAFEAQKGRNTELSTKLSEAETKIRELPEDFDPQKWHEYKQATEGDKTKKDKAVEDMTRLHEARIQAMQAQHVTDLKTRDDAILQRDTQIDQMALSTELTDLLVKAKVDEALMAGARAVLSSKVKIVRADDGSRAMMVETNVGPQPLREFMKTWAETDGRPYIARASGPEAGGGGRGGDGRQMLRSEFLKLPPAKQSEIALKGDVKIVDPV